MSGFLPGASGVPFSFAYGLVESNGALSIGVNIDSAQQLGTGTYNIDYTSLGLSIVPAILITPVTNAVSVFAIVEAAPGLESAADITVFDDVGTLTDAAFFVWLVSSG